MENNNLLNTRRQCQTKYYRRLANGEIKEYTRTLTYQVKPPISTEVKNRIIEKRKLGVPIAKISRDEGISQFKIRGILSE